MWEWKRERITERKARERDETGTREFRKFVERANGASWLINEKFDPVVTARDVNNLGVKLKENSGEEKKRCRPRRENLTDLDLIARENSAEIFFVLKRAANYSETSKRYCVTRKENIRDTWSKRISRKIIKTYRK